MDFVQRNIAFLGADWTEVGALMRSALGSDIRLLNETNEAILSHGGKMLRPAMSLLVSRALGGTVSDGGRKVAAAAELLHNATLLHDDVADASPERRGVPTTSSLLGDRAAVLLGETEAGPEGIIRSLDEYAEQIRDSAVMNSRRWPGGGGTTGRGAGGDFDNAIRYMKDWISARTEWMDGEYGTAAPENAQ